MVFSFKSKGAISSAMSATAIQIQNEKSELTVEGATVSSAMPLGQALSIYNGNNYDHTVTLTNVTFNGRAGRQIRACFSEL